VEAVSTNHETQTVLGWGFFSSVGDNSRVFAPIPPADFAGRPSDPSFDTFFSRAVLPIKRPKSAKAARHPITDQPVTRGRFKRFDCVIGLARGNDRLWHFTTHLRYIGYFDNYRRIGTSPPFGEQ
jgi:hypothetical protein